MLGQVVVQCMGKPDLLIGVVAGQPPSMSSRAARCDIQVSFTIATKSPSSLTIYQILTFDFLLLAGDMISARALTPK